MMTLEVLEVDDLKMTQQLIDGDVKREGAPCPQAEQIARFVLGLCEGEELDGMIRHVRFCEHCRLMVNVTREVVETMD